MNYTQSYLLQNPPAMIKDFEVWSYVVNKMTNQGSNEISIAGVIKYYHTKVKYLLNKI
jgi:hypothetical protein